MVRDSIVEQICALWCGDGEDTLCMMKLLDTCWIELFTDSVYVASAGSVHWEMQCVLGSWSDCSGIRNRQRERLLARQEFLGIMVGREWIHPHAPQHWRTLWYLRNSHRAFLRREGLNYRSGAVDHPEDSRQPE